MDPDAAIDTALDVGGRLAAAVVVLVVGYIVAAVARRLSRRLLEQPAVARALGPSMVRLLGTVVFCILFAIAVGIALITIGVPERYVGTIALLIIALLALSLQQSLANLAATVTFLLFQPIRRGELVETMGFMGTVQEILLFNTVILLPDHRLVTLPNGKIQESGIVNYTRQRRVMPTFSLTVGYGEDLARVRTVIAEIVDADPRVLRDEPVVVAVDELGELGVRLIVFAAVAPHDFWNVRSDLQEQVKARFDAEGIRFAVPPRDIRLSPVESSRPADGVKS
jgi:small conductance mechanosensitive channel